MIWHGNDLVEILGLMDYYFICEDRRVLLFEIRVRDYVCGDFLSCSY